MPTTTWIPVVKQIKDGLPVDAANTNPILQQFTQREQYLYEKFQELENKSVLIAFAQDVHPSDVSTVAVGQVMYFNNVGGSGLSAAKVEFTSTGASSLYSPSNSCFVYGIVKSITTISGGKQADVYTEGLVTLDFNIDDPTVGLLESGETFAVGPYYLSRTEAGKLTKIPGGVAVFVGYAKSATEFLLSPNVEELAQLFIHYKFSPLDRPNGTPVLTGSTWTVTSPDVTVHNPPLTTGAINRVGWIGVADIPTNIVPAVDVPAGALFFYGLPQLLASSDSAVVTAVDNPGISTDERTESRELLNALPPYPADFTQLFVNGVAQEVRDDIHPAGSYSIDRFGIWWYLDQDGYQPWASDLTSGVWVPTDWPSDKGTENLRPKMMLQFLKFNPDLRSALVTSLVGFNDSTNNTANMLKFYDVNSGAEANHGDLLAKLNLNVTTPAESPVTGTAVKSLVFDAPNGQTVATVGPVISSVIAGSGIAASTNLTTGAVTISSQTTGLTGQIYSIEPENARLEFIGLHSYLNLVPSTTLSTGFVGKIFLAPGSPSVPLSIVLHLFGKTAISSLSSIKYCSFNYEYAISVPKTVAGSNPNLNYTINTSTTVYGSPVNVALPFPYTAYEDFVVTPVEFIIPATKIIGDSVVNFRLTRTTSTYLYDVGVIAAYWKLG